ncbi:antitoxin VbhA family protein [Pseudomonas silvicola]|nr:antitoxin VbhA family protein [Pseudomonas silvicola]
MKRMKNMDVVELTDAERTRRQDAVDYARVSLALEGFTLTPDLERHALAFVNGELTLVEFISSVDFSRPPAVR